MKRIIALLLIFIELLALTACGDTQPKTPDDTIDTPQHVTPANDAVKPTEPPEGLKYFYLEYEADEMTEERAAFRNRCDATRYMDTRLASDKAYLSTLAEWSAMRSTWDYARFTGFIQSLEYTQDGYTLMMMKLWPYLDRQVIVSMRGTAFLEVGQLITTYGLIGVASYQDGIGDPTICFAMEVLDYCGKGFMNTAALEDDGWHNIAIGMPKVGAPVDWNLIPDTDYAEWFGLNRTFGTGDGYWYDVTAATIGGLAYTVQYWYWQPEYNLLTLGVTLNDYEDVFDLEAGNPDLIWLNFQDVHLMTFVSSMLHDALWEASESRTSKERAALADVIGDFYGTAMYWPAWDTAEY